MPPSTPQFGSLRLATLVDVPRLGVVATASLFHSSWFSYKRPYYKDFPLDTLASYSESFAKAILNPDLIVLVSEDILDEREDNYVYSELAAAYPALEQQIPREIFAVGRVIVSAAIFSLPPGSARCGQFQTEPPDTKPSKPNLEDRDSSHYGSELFDKSVHPHETAAFEGRLVIDRIVTHPAYWRRGHAEKIVRWFIDLSECDSLGMGVAGAPMGKLLFLSMGFTEAEVVEIPGYDAHPESIEAWIGLRDCPSKSM